MQQCHAHWQYCCKMNMYRTNNACKLTSLPFTPALLRREWSVIQYHAYGRNPGTLITSSLIFIPPSPTSLRDLSIKREYWSANVPRRSNPTYPSHRRLGWHHRSGNKNSVHFLGVEPLFLCRPTCC